MQRSELIDKIFADALSQMEQSGATKTAESSPMANGETTSEVAENNLAQEATVSGQANDGEVDDLDALLANITAAQPSEEDGGINEDDLGEILAPDAASEEEWNEENSVTDGALSDVIDSALTIEDVPAANEAEIIEESSGVPVETFPAESETVDAAVESLAENAETPSAAASASSASDNEVEDALRALGLDGDSTLLCNKFSSEKEVLLKHLLQRFEMIARRKLQDLPNEQVKLVRSVNLRVELELKFGEFSAAGNDDSLFQL